jgi:hypothetical protein
MLSAECRDVFRFGRYSVCTDRRILCGFLHCCLVQQLYLVSIAANLDCTVASYGVCVCVCVRERGSEREREREGGC